MIPPLPAPVNDAGTGNHGFAVINRQITGDGIIVDIETEIFGNLAEKTLINELLGQFAQAVHLIDTVSSRRPHRPPYEVFCGTGPVFAAGLFSCVELECLLSGAKQKSLSGDGTSVRSQYRTYLGHPRKVWV